MAELTSEDLRALEIIRKDREERARIPESERREVSKELQNRMQNEAEAGYVPVSEEQRQKWRKQWLNPEAD